MKKVLIDTCVLYPTVAREVLLQVAKAGLFQPLWSPRILEEWAHAARKIGPAGQVQAQAEIALATAAWPNAIVTPKEGDMARLWLPDENDIHVLAAAIAGSADLILTWNAKDFPRHTLHEEGIDRNDPDSFLMKLWLDRTNIVTEAADRIYAQSRNLENVPKTRRALLKKARLPRLARALDR
ncbi:RSP_2648 family PIN domain-containing protein [Actibacterium sp. 188UL27-1]|uniref:RSP_2648 family PIN domain-containing protein n=1 Tax=Actibacterium sp. 188UL27-1 TaxID=2786961 RepID=UPI00195882A2|nr:PIN domain-containing protein [Actibacterium sp. 188UL27-1]MBM7066720.1 PIN domain-containing protein [Actibacterium sp. 188UL27-1]